MLAVQFCHILLVGRPYTIFTQLLIKAMLFYYLLASNQLITN